MSSATPQTELQPFDFTKPAGVASESTDKWLAWVDNIIRDFTERWLIASGCRITITSGSQTTLRFDVARERVPKPSIATVICLSSNEFPSLLAFDRALVLGLALQLLGDKSQQWPDDRALTEIETSVTDFLYERLLETFGESWLQKEALPTRLKEVDLLPHRSRLWDPKKTVFVCCFDFTIGESTSTAQWILPLSELEQLLDVLNDRKQTDRGGVVAKIEQRAYDIPVEVSMALQGLRLPVSTLASLSPGDVLVFDHKIYQPLPVLVDKKPKFDAWLGRVGKRQAARVARIHKPQTRE